MNVAPPAPAKLLTPDEVAEKYGLSTATLRAWRARRMGPAWTKIGRNVFYTPAALAAFEASRTVQPA